MGCFTQDHAINAAVLTPVEPSFDLSPGRLQHKSADGAAAATESAFNEDGTLRKLEIGKVGPLHL